jgi:hypothetical protein
MKSLSNASFMNTYLTGVRFSDKARWEGEKAKEDDRFKIVDERLLEKEIKEKNGHTTKDFNLGSIKNLSLTFSLNGLLPAPISLTLFLLERYTFFFHAPHIYFDSISP